jgi:hypothetical protein
MPCQTALSRARCIAVCTIDFGECISVRIIKPPNLLNRSSDISGQRHSAKLNISGRLPASRLSGGLKLALPAMN